MFNFRRCILAFVLFVIPFSIFAQEEENTEKQKQLQQLAEQILSDAQNLNLSENRAVVFAQVGSHLWTTDEKRARKLFQDSINELINAQNLAENDSSENYSNYGLFYGQSPRWNVLNLIASRDAEFALEVQLKSRPTSILELIAFRSLQENKPKKVIANQHYVVQELNMENQFKLMAAEQNPDRAVELFRKSLKSGVAYNAINFLQNLHKKSPETADKLLEETFEKLLSMSLAENDGSNDFNTMINFLTTFGNEKLEDGKSFTVSDDLLRKLANKISNHWLKLRNSYYYNESAFKIIERFYPNRLSQIVRKENEQNNNDAEYLRYNEFTKNNPTAEDMLREAENFSSYRNTIYSQAANKLAQEGNVAEAINILNSNFISQEAKQQIAGIYQNLSSQAISKGNFEEAESLINQIPSNQQKIYSLTYLAQSIFSKNPEENKGWAISILDKADYLIEQPVSTLNDVASKINIASAFIKIEPKRTFQIIEPLTQILNEYSRAQAVVSKLRNDGSSKNGEYLIENAHNIAGTYALANVLQQLQTADFDRTMQLINGFERFETRLALKLQLLSQISQSQISNLPINTRVVKGRMS